MGMTKSSLVKWWNSESTSRLIDLAILIEEEKEKTERLLMQVFIAMYENRRYISDPELFFLFEIKIEKITQMILSNDYESKSCVCFKNPEYFRFIGINREHKLSNQLNNLLSDVILNIDKSEREIYVAYKSSILNTSELYNLFDLTKQKLSGIIFSVESQLTPLLPNLSEYKIQPATNTIKLHTQIMRKIRAFRLKHVMMNMTFNLLSATVLTIILYLIWYRI